MAKKNNNNKNVHLAKTRISGTIFMAPLGTPLPQNASDELNEAFENIGYIGEDGITISTDTKTAEIKDMGGNVILTVITSFGESLKFVMLETNKTALSLRYESENVTGDESTSLKVEHKMPKGEKHAIVIDLFLTGNKRNRHVISSSSPSEYGDIAYVAGTAIGREVTLALDPDDANGGATDVEYIETIKA